MANKVILNSGRVHQNREADQLSHAKLLSFHSSHDRRWRCLDCLSWTFYFSCDSSRLVQLKKPRGPPFWELDCFKIQQIYGQPCSAPNALFLRGGTQGLLDLPHYSRDLHSDLCPQCIVYSFCFCISKQI